MAGEQDAWVSAHRLGIMGGTFDPIHYGHLVAAEAARHEFALDHVLFVPAAQPPHKDLADVTGVHHRLTMTVLATVTHAHFAVSKMEMERQEPSYTIDTLRQLRQRLGEQTELYFITGADAIIEITTWRDPAGLFELARFIAAIRPGYPLSQYRAILRSLNEEQRSRIHRLDVPLLAISSSDIRRKVAAQKPIRYLLPEPVRHYINRYRLYQPAG